ncbi:hypothetical protein ACK1CN_09580 [Vibrio coralliilyticus]|uniref:hypothetical protein n=1 Tax=Vibrio coralliilyticus TaxID=190893 RepID=UPI0039172A9F
MAKRIIFIHGRAQKPSESDLQQLWYDAIKHGLKRDYGGQGLQGFESVAKEFVYYGDLSNKLLKLPVENATSRFHALEKLKTYSKGQFTKKKYKELAKAGFWKEGLADIFSAPFGKLGVATSLISVVAPDMEHYWNGDSYFGSDVRQKLTPVLKSAFAAEDDIMLVGHSLGSMICYDNLWKLSHYSEYREDFGANKKVNLFVTLGSPLADENVKKRLKGANNGDYTKYPTNINRWYNIAAEDDFISHDSRVRNDYKQMMKLNLLSEPIQDFKIYNLNVRNGKSNPHASIGYLIHPKFISILNDWMNS